MPVMWIQHEQEQRWCPVALNGEAVALPANSELQVGGEVAHAAAIVLSAGAGGDRLVMARTGAAVWVNGEPLLLGVRVLRDRDVIRVGSGECAVYSAESLASVGYLSGPCAGGDSLYPHFGTAYR